MGDRGSIQVVRGDQKSIVLFRHWGGSPEAMIELCETIAPVIEKHKQSKMNDPYSRCDPDAVIALLTRYAVESEEYSAYLGKDENDGDNSDNGHYVLKANTTEDFRCLATELHLINEEGKEIWSKRL